MMLKEKPFYLDDEAIAWVEEALTGMTLEEKVGQLFCVLLRGSTQEECDFIRGILSPGGAMYRPMPVESAVQATNMLQQGSRIPLLIAANLEKGGNGIVTEGTLMGSPMEVAATDSADMAVVKPAMVVASVTTRPLKPSLPRNRPLIISLESEAGSMSPSPSAGLRRLL